MTPSRPAADPLLPSPPHAAGFRPHQRLLKPAQFDRVFKQGRRYTNPYLTVLFAERSDPVNTDPLAQPYLGPRLGFAVAKKSIADATGRNQLKRIVREQFRQHAVELRAVDLVVMAKPPAARATREQLHGAIATCWAHLKKHCAAR